MKIRIPEGAKRWARVAAARLRGMGARLERDGRLARLGRYAALLALVVMLGAASMACRRQLAESRSAQSRQVTAAALPRAVSDTPAPSPSPEPARWTWPVDGEIVGAYSPDALAWSDTLGQWQTHPAVDIAAAPGEAVYACADGTVTDAFKDRLWGNVILVDHGDGCTATYANLNTLNLVEVGQAVKMGDVISAVGRSADCESGMDWHLHFALEKDGRPVDPGAILPKQGD